MKVRLQLHIRLKLSGCLKFLLRVFHTEEGWSTLESPNWSKYPQLCPRLMRHSLIENKVLLKPISELNKTKTRTACVSFSLPYFLSSCLFICSSYVSVCLYFCLLVCSVEQPVNMLVCLVIFISIGQSVCPSFRMLICLSIRLSVCLSVSLSIWQSLHVSVSMSD